VSERQYVGIDLHRRRSVIVRVDREGNHLSTVRVANDPLEVARAVEAAGPNPEVVVEATYGYYWLVDLLEELGATTHLANPSGLNWGNRRVKNDERDALDLVKKLRLGELPEAWIPPPAVRELRELVRYRAKAVRLRSGLKAQVHAVMAKNGVLPARYDMFGPGGLAQLDALGDQLPVNYAIRIDSLRDLIEIYDREVATLERAIHRQLKDHPGYQAILQIPGVGPTLGAVFVAEIGDVSRFSSAEKLCSWAGLTPKHRESDTKVIRGRVTKQGSKLVRWAAIEAVAKNRGGTRLQADYHRIAERRGKQKARTAVARKLLVYVYYGLRDGVIRSLRPTEEAA
jgi:transposase